MSLKAEIAEKKLEENKKKFKEFEFKASKQIAQLEKEKNSLTEKINFLENKKTENEKRLIDEIKDLKSQLSCTKEYDSMGMSIYLVENEKLKEKTNELEKNVVELGAFYERDKVL